MAGESYESIARAGGGILATVMATRAATQQQLTDGALPRVDALLAGSVTTLEVKSGYGPGVRDRAADAAGRAAPSARPGACRWSRPTWARNALPVEFSGNAAATWRGCARVDSGDGASGAADAFDAYGEHLAFTPEQVGGGLLPPPAPTAAPEVGTPISCRTSRAPRWPRGTLRCRPITWNIRMRRAWRRWRGGHRAVAAARRLLFPARAPASAR